MSKSNGETQQALLGANKKLRRHVRILVELGRLAAKGGDLDRFLDNAIIQVARAIEIDHAKVLSYRKKTADLLMVAGVGWADGAVRTATFPSDLRSPSGRSFQTAEPVVVEDISRAADFTFAGILKEHGIVSLANVPIVINGAAWGVLEVDSTLRCNFSEDTLDFMTAAAAIIGAAVQQQTSGQSEAAARAAAAAATQTREVLLREMEHRVKNNFQVILASIALQKRRFAGTEVHRALEHVANRINAVSLAHNQLMPNREGHTVDVAGYLRALCASIEQQAEDVSIEVDADEVEMAIDRAVPLGLILNEAVTNSIKHAFGEEGGRVSVGLKTGVGYGQARLSVTDNGKGMTASAKVKKSSRSGGSGLQLIGSLARQIGGDFEQESSPQGTSIIIEFPVV
jgi:two-component sensor histidine kinase